MFPGIRSVLVAVLVAAFAAPVFAVTYIVPPDAEMIQKSDDIVVATAVSSVALRTPRGGIVTRYTLRVEEALKGDRAAGSLIELTELGGRLSDTEWTLVPGAPSYAPGTRYLVFTETNNAGDPTTFGMELGQFSFVDHGGKKLAVRAEIGGLSANLEPHQEGVRDAAKFAAYIRGIVAQRISPEPAYFVPVDARRIRGQAVETNAGFTRSSYLFKGAPRWKSPFATFVRAGVQGGGVDGPAAVALAFAEWNSTATSIDYADGGVDETAVAGFTVMDHKSAILFGDPNSEISDTSGVVGVGGISEGAPAYSLDGESFDDIKVVDVVINNVPMTQSCLNTVMVHEIGHTLGFRHADENGVVGMGFPGPCETGQDCATDAIMNHRVSCGWNGALKGYDQRAAETVYGDAVCDPPTIGTQPQNKTTEVGAVTFLSVTAGGTGPFSFEWFRGTTGDTSNPIADGTSNTLDVTPTATGVVSYWVRVGHACDALTVNSNTVTVTATCTNPAITTQSGNPTINGGQSTVLQVTATGSALTFQWFKGMVGDVSTPVGTNSNRLTVSPTETTSYWVHISGACGAPVDSQTFVVTVIPCAEIAVGAPTATPGTGTGKYTLHVDATSTAGGLTYGWFRGGTPGFGGSPAGSGQSINVTVTAATNYWARVQNACGRVEFSTLITVAPCTLPSISAQPQDPAVINSGATANLSMAVSAGATVKWYRGTVGDKTTQVGTTANVTVGPLTQTTKFWAEVSNTCGAVSSREVTVTVRQLTELVNLLNNRFFVQVNYKNQFDNGKEGKLLGRSLFSTALSETAVFTFGDANVVELLVRVSDARPFDNHIHVFLGGLSDVELSVVVTDSLTGIVHEYKKPANQLIGVIDRATFPASNVLPAPIALKIAPAAESSTIRLLNNRFEVRMRYRNQFTNPPGEGYMNARSIASSPTTETAVFFFDENVGSAEWMVRFSDARPFANRIDMFHGGLSDVEFTIEVLDTQTGQRKEYHKAPFSLVGEVDRDSYLP